MINTINTRDDPKSGWKKTNNHGTITIKKGSIKSLTVEIIFFSKNKARMKIVLNLATSEGWKEKIPTLSHLWAPETVIPKK